MTDAVVNELVLLLGRVRERRRSSWPALVVTEPDDEAHGHEAFAALAEAESAALADDPVPPVDASSENPSEADADDVIESSSRVRILAAEPRDYLPASYTDSDAHCTDSPLDDEAPELLFLGERPLEATDVVPLPRAANTPEPLVTAPRPAVPSAVPSAEPAHAARAVLGSSLPLGDLVSASLALRPRIDAW